MINQDRSLNFGSLDDHEISGTVSESVPKNPYHLINRNYNHFNNILYNKNNYVLYNRDDYRLMMSNYWMQQTFRKIDHLVEVNYSDNYRYFFDDKNLSVWIKKVPVFIKYHHRKKFTFVNPNFGFNLFNDFDNYYHIDLRVGMLFLISSILSLNQPNPNQKNDIKKNRFDEIILNY